MIVEIESVKDPVFQTLFITYFQELGIVLEDETLFFHKLYYDTTSEQSKVIVLKEQGQYIGFAIYQVQVFQGRYYTHTVGELTHLYIEKSQRHKGYGQQLVAYIKADFKSQQIHRMILETSSALAFYERLGFLKDETYQSKDDATIYRLEIA